MQGIFDGPMRADSQSEALQVVGFEAREVVASLGMGLAIECTGAFYPAEAFEVWPEGFILEPVDVVREVVFAFFDSSMVFLGCF